MTLAEAQTLAANQHAELVRYATGDERIFRLVDDALRSDFAHTDNGPNHRAAANPAIASGCKRTPRGPGR